MTVGLLVVEDTPASEDIRALIDANVRDNYETSPADSVHVFDAAALGSPYVTLWSARDAATRTLLGIGAIARLTATSVELKSMRTVEEARGRGVASQIVRTIRDVCRERGIEVIFLETGVEDFFAPARAMYAKLGFVECGPFGDYVEDSNTVFMTLRV
ncbi:putative acetyltransferase [Microbacterium phyllosphaerae]|uniref:Acetyltransferase n=1 Tax=Microbacterium phyllosphaerae TaxID=124798 RepID=A0ABS4WLJ4_9MICO|nr:GNAT family N-acetyltransferase [Microbacterium phyllosphaerae]MBP2376901.1 putative acetyltransferase [Microbacterium phyllosphaerae]